MEIIQELRRNWAKPLHQLAQLSELALLCDSVTILDRGAVVTAG